MNVLSKISTSISNINTSSNRGFDDLDTSPRGGDRRNSGTGSLDNGSISGYISAGGTRRLRSPRALGTIRGRMSNKHSMAINRTVLVNEIKANISNPDPQLLQKLANIILESDDDGSTPVSVVYCGVALKEWIIHHHAHPVASSTSPRTQTGAGATQSLGTVTSAPLITNSSSNLDTASVENPTQNAADPVVAYKSPTAKKEQNVKSPARGGGSSSSSKLPPKELLHLARGHLDIWLRRGVAADYYHLVRARQLFEEYMSSARQSIPVADRISYCKVLLFLGEVKLAAEVITTVVTNFESDPNIANYLFYAGVIHKALGMYEKANDFFFEANQSGPPSHFSQIEMMTIISRNLEEMGTAEDADISEEENEDAYKMVHAHLVLEGAIPEDTDYDDWISDAHTWLELGDKCAVHNMFPLATDFYGIGLMKDIDAFKRPMLWYRFAKACNRCGRTADAQLAVKQALSRDPYNKQLKRAYRFWHEPDTKAVAFDELVSGELSDIIALLPEEPDPQELSLRRLQAVMKGALERTSLLIGVGARRDINRRMKAKIGIVVKPAQSPFATPVDGDVSASLPRALLLKVQPSWMGKITHIEVYDVRTDRSGKLKLKTPFAPVKETGVPRKLKLTMECRKIKSLSPLNHTTEYENRQGSMDPRKGSVDVTAHAHHGSQGSGSGVGRARNPTARRRGKGRRKSSVGADGDPTGTGGLGGAEDEAEDDSDDDVDVEDGLYTVELVLRFTDEGTGQYSYRRMKLAVSGLPSNLPTIPGSVAGLDSGLLTGGDSGPTPNLRTTSTSRISAVLEARREADITSVIQLEDVSIAEYRLTAAGGIAPVASHAAITPRSARSQHSGLLLLPPQPDDHDDGQEESKAGSKISRSSHRSVSTKGSRVALAYEHARMVAAGDGPPSYPLQTIPSAESMRSIDQEDLSLPEMMLGVEGVEGEASTVSLTNSHMMEIVKTGVRWNSEYFLFRVVNEEDVTQVTALHVSTNSLFVFLTVREYIDRTVRLDKKWDVLLRLVTENPILAPMLRGEPALSGADATPHENPAFLHGLYSYVDVQPYGGAATIILIDPNNQPILGTGFELVEEDPNAVPTSVQPEHGQRGYAVLDGMGSSLGGGDGEGEHDLMGERVYAGEEDEVIMGPPAEGEFSSMQIGGIPGVEGSVSQEAGQLELGTDSAYELVVDAMRIGEGGSFDSYRDGGLENLTETSQHTQPSDPSAGLSPEELAALRLGGALDDDSMSALQSGQSINMPPRPHDGGNGAREERGASGAIDQQQQGPKPEPEPVVSANAADEAALQAFGEALNALDGGGDANDNAAANAAAVDSVRAAKEAQADLPSPTASILSTLSAEAARRSIAAGHTLEDALVAAEKERSELQQRRAAEESVTMPFESPTKGIAAATSMDANTETGITAASVTEPEVVDDAFIEEVASDEAVRLVEQSLTAFRDGAGISDFNSLIAEAVVQLANERITFLGEMAEQYVGELFSYTLPYTSSKVAAYTSIMQQILEKSIADHCSDIAKTTVFDEMRQRDDHYHYLASLGFGGILKEIVTDDVAIPVLEWAENICMSKEDINRHQPSVQEIKDSRRRSSLMVRQQTLKRLHEIHELMPKEPSLAESEEEGRPEDDDSDDHDGSEPDTDSEKNNDQEDEEEREEEVTKVVSPRRGSEHVDPYFVTRIRSLVDIKSTDTESAVVHRARPSVTAFSSMSGKVIPTILPRRDTFTPQLPKSLLADVDADADDNDDDDCDYHQGVEKAGIPEKELAGTEASKRKKSTAAAGAEKQQRKLRPTIIEAPSVLHASMPRGTRITLVENKSQIIEHRAHSPDGDRRAKSPNQLLQESIQLQSEEQATLPMVLFITNDDDDDGSEAVGDDNEGRGVGESNRQDDSFNAADPRFTSPAARKSQTAAPGHSKDKDRLLPRRRSVAEISSHNREVLLNRRNQVKSAPNSSTAATSAVNIGDQLDASPTAGNGLTAGSVDDASSVAAAAAAVVALDDAKLRDSYYEFAPLQELGSGDHCGSPFAPGGIDHSWSMLSAMDADVHQHQHQKQQKQQDQRELSLQQKAQPRSLSHLSKKGHIQQAVAADTPSSKNRQKAASINTFYTKPENQLPAGNLPSYAFDSADGLKRALQQEWDSTTAKKFFDASLMQQSHATLDNRRELQRQRQNQSRKAKSKARTAPTTAAAAADGGGGNRVAKSGEGGGRKSEGRSKSRGGHSRQASRHGHGRSTTNGNDTDSTGAAPLSSSADSVYIVEPFSRLNVRVMGRGPADHSMQFRASHPAIMDGSDIYMADKPHEDLFQQSLSSFHRIGYIQQRQRPIHHATHWHRKVVKFLAGVTSVADLRKRIAMLRRTAPEVLTPEEAVVALAETDGSVGEVIEKLRNLEFFTELRLVCRSVNVKSLVLMLDEGNVIYDDVKHSLPNSRPGTADQEPEAPLWNAYDTTDWNGEVPAEFSTTLVGREGTEDQNHRTQVSSGGGSGVGGAEQQRPMSALQRALIELDEEEFRRSTTVHNPFSGHRMEHHPEIKKYMQIRKDYDNYLRASSPPQSSHHSPSRDERPVRRPASASAAGDMSASAGVDEYEQYVGVASGVTAFDSVENPAGAWESAPAPAGTDVDADADAGGARWQRVQRGSAGGGVVDVVAESHEVVIDGLFQATKRPTLSQASPYVLRRASVVQLSSPSTDSAHGAGGMGGMGGTGGGRSRGPSRAASVDMMGPAQDGGTDRPISPSAGAEGAQAAQAAAGGGVSAVRGRSFASSGSNRLIKSSISLANTPRNKLSESSSIAAAIHSAVAAVESAEVNSPMPVSHNMRKGNVMNSVEELHKGISFKSAAAKRVFAEGEKLKSWGSKSGSARPSPTASRDDFDRSLELDRSISVGIAESERGDGGEQFLPPFSPPAPSSTRPASSGLRSGSRKVGNVSFTLQQQSAAGITTAAVEAGGVETDYNYDITAHEDAGTADESGRVKKNLSKSTDSTEELQSDSEGTSGKKLNRNPFLMMQRQHGQDSMVSLNPWYSKNVPKPEALRGTRKSQGTFRISGRIEDMFDSLDAPIVVMSRRDAIKAEREELLLKSNKLYIRDPIVQRGAQITRARSASQKHLLTARSGSQRDVVLPQQPPSPTAAVPPPTQYE